jgi:hypothetical protein
LGSLPRSDSSEAGRRDRGATAIQAAELRGRGRTSAIWAQNKAGQKWGGRKKIKEKGFLFEKRPNQTNPNTNLNSSTQKQCTSMYATVNPYFHYLIKKND